MAPTSNVRGVDEAEEVEESTSIPAIHHIEPPVAMDIDIPAQTSNGPPKVHLIRYITALIMLTCLYSARDAAR